MPVRVSFWPHRICECPLTRLGHAGAIIHQHPCKEQGVTWLAQSGDPIIPGKRYRRILEGDFWDHDYHSDVDFERNGTETSVVAKVTRVDQYGMVFAYWHDDLPLAEDYGFETGIPHIKVVELVE